MKGYDYKIDTINRGRILELMLFLKSKGGLLLNLLENPILLEKEIFTELLRAIFHLREELIHRPDLNNLPETDNKHLSGDIRRAYILLIRQWTEYMEYLKEHYPYLFSLAMRTNPFNPKSSHIVK